MAVEKPYPGVPLPQEVVSVPPLVATETELSWIGAVDERVAARLADIDTHLGKVEIAVATVASGAPTLDVDESYQLCMRPDGIRLQAATTWGALHGIATLHQLCALADLREVGFDIEDQPRFAWRGLLIDVARHFIPLAVLLRVVDGLSLLKMNVLHLHLTDDQAFRFPSKAFPELVAEQAYSVADLSTLVDYAAQRGVRVVPEIDVPGHVQSWLVAHPEWGGRQVAPSQRFGVHKACLDPTDDAVYTALATLFKEVADIFPDEYIHIGGDEVHPAWWSEDAPIQQFIADHHLKDVRGLQAYFNRRVHEVISQLGKRAIGWDEVLHPDMPPIVVQNWRGATTRDRALVRGLDCVVSAGFYLDLFYPADVHYRYDIALPQEELVRREDALKEDLRFQHVAAGMAWTEQWREEAINASETSGRLLGGEACLWSELVDGATLETRLFSRLPAVAERLWSQPEANDIEGFYSRLGPLLDLPAFSLRTRQERQLLQIGVTSSQAEVLSYLEPVKWYARLLGEEVLAARIAGSEMPQARPYTSETPLDRVADVLAPESLTARKLCPRQGESVDIEMLTRVASVWADVDPGTYPEDVRGALAVLHEVGHLVQRYLANGEDVSRQLRELYVPQGEYLVAAIPPLLECFDK